MRQLKLNYKWSTLAIASFFLFLPLITGKESYTLYVLIIVVIQTILVWGLDLLLDCALISCAQIAFWGMGSYTYALLCTRWEWDPLLAILASGIIPTVISVLVSYSSIRLKTLYWCLFSLVFAVMFQQTLIVWRSFLGGPTGIWGIPPLPFISSYAGHYYLAIFLIFLMALVIYQLRRSRIGLILHGMRYSEDLARSAGISIVRYRLLSLVVANFFAGISGGFYAAFTGVCSPANLELHATFALFVYIIVGGRGTLSGCLIGTALLIFIKEILGPLGVYIPIIYGVVVIFFVLLFPGGIISLPKRLLERLY